MQRYILSLTILAIMGLTPALAADPTGGDTSTGAKEQSSAPQGSAAEKDTSSGAASGQSSDTSLEEQRSKVPLLPAHLQPTNPSQTPRWVRISTNYAPFSAALFGWR